MAGAGFKTFVDGDVLSAADVNTYLMEQAVMVFADASARSTAITAPSEGMVTYLKDTNQTQYYTGSAWETIGLGGLNLITETTVTAQASVAFDDVFTAAYRNYVIQVAGSASVGTTVLMQLRASGADLTTADYQQQAMYVANTSITGTRNVNQTQFYAFTGRTTSTAATIFVYRPQEAAATFITTQETDSNSDVQLNFYAGHYDQNTQADGFRFFVPSGALTNKIAVYGFGV